MNAKIPWCAAFEDLEPLHQEMKKVILKVHLHDERTKLKAMKSISGLKGVESISMNTKDQKMTVIGGIDSIDVFNKLSKLCSTEILSVGPAEEKKKKKEEPKKEEPKEEEEEEEPKQEEPKKEKEEEEPKKEEPKKDKKEEPKKDKEEEEPKKEEPKKDKEEEEPKKEEPKKDKEEEKAKEKRERCNEDLERKQKKEVSRTIDESIAAETITIQDPYRSEVPHLSVPASVTLNAKIPGCAACEVLKPLHQEMKKVILKVHFHDERTKQKAMKSISGLQGLESISVDTKDQKMTVIGDVDPVAVVRKLRKFCSTEVLSVGRAKEEKKKEEPKKEEPKKNENAELLKAYQGYYSAHHYAGPHYFVRSVEEEDPNACAIC